MKIVSVDGFSDQIVLDLETDTGERFTFTVKPSSHSGLSALRCAAAMRKLTDVLRRITGESVTCGAAIVTEHLVGDSGAAVWLRTNAGPAILSMSATDAAKIPTGSKLMIDVRKE